MYYKSVPFDCLVIHKHPKRIRVKRRVPSFIISLRDDVHQTLLSLTLYCKHQWIPFNYTQKWCKTRYLDLKKFGQHWLATSIFSLNVHVSFYLYINYISNSRFRQSKSPIQPEYQFYYFVDVLLLFWPKYPIL